MAEADEIARPAPPAQPSGQAEPGPSQRDWAGALGPSAAPGADGQAEVGFMGSALYEKGKTVHNKRIDGPFRRFKWLVMLVTLTIYYVTPWIRWDRGPYAPDQAVLVDLAHRRFYMFDIEI